jgi:hypothetical protein
MAADTAQADNAGNAGKRLFIGRLDYQGALRETLLAACVGNSRELIWVDASEEPFVDWPLSEAPVLDALTAWVRPGRRLHLLAAQYDSLARRHPRFVRWRGTWSHAIDARAFDAEAATATGRANLAAILLGQGGSASFSLRLFDTLQWRGAQSVEAADALRAREWFDALAQRSCESFAVTTLGL